MHNGPLVEGKCVVPVIARQLWMRDGEGLKEQEKVGGALLFSHGRVRVSQRWDLQLSAQWTGIVHLLCQRGTDYSLPQPKPVRPSKFLFTALEAGPDSYFSRLKMPPFGNYGVCVCVCMKGKRVTREDPGFLETELLK